MVTILLLAVSAVIWFILPLEEEGRTLSDRFVGVRIDDVRSEGARILELKSIARHSGRETYFAEAETGPAQ